MECVGKVNDMMADVKSLVVTLQGLLERNGPQFDDLVETLKATMRNLEELTRTLADQPQAIIRGKEPVGRQ
jgi:ABC-type transporter Mla subunit MlaD